MMIPPMLTSEVSINSSKVRSHWRAPSLALCMLGLLGSAACSGDVNDSEDVAKLPPANGTTNDRANGSGARTTGDGASTGTASAAGETDPRNVNANEQSSDDISRVAAGSSVGTRRGSGGRVRPVEPPSDAGAIDRVDAGEADAGFVEADAGVIDAGVAGDAGAAVL